MKKLTLTFSIPKNRIKNANTPMNYIVSANKSAWIREYSEKIWVDAIKEQFGIIALEPDLNSLPTIEKSEELVAVLDRINKIEDEILETNEILEHCKKNNKIKEWKKELRVAKKEKNEDITTELENKIYDHEQKISVLKAKIKRLKSLKSSVKSKNDKNIKKELRKINNAERKNYIDAKLNLNKNNRLFETCAVIVKISNITNREFDAPNFYPTVKPILDAGTDTGILWEDDNNSIITGGMLFLKGNHQNRDSYIIEIEVVDEWEWKKLTQENVL